MYDIKKDELYVLDGESFGFLNKCSGENGCASPPEGDFLEFCLNEGILNSDFEAVRRPPAYQSPRPSLRYLELQITRRCNLKCRHCYLGPASSIDLPLESVESALDNFEKMQGLRLLVTGGEPLMHGDFEKINSLLKDYAFRKILLTNGTLINESLLKRLNFDEIQISIDGLQDAHDYLRGKGTFRRAFGSLKSALDEGLDASVSTMVHPKSIRDLPEMEKILIDAGVKGWDVDIPCIEGTMKDNRSLHLSPDIAGEFLRYGFGGGLHGDDDSGGFACGLHLMAVTASGDTAKCLFYAEEPSGHLSEGLEQCWERIKPVPLGMLDCDCPAIESCRGGCRYRAKITGSPLGKDPFRCAFYGKI